MSQSASGSLSSQSPSVVRAEVDIPSLYVKRVVQGSDDELSMAVFGVHAQDGDGDDVRIEKVWSIVKKGQRVKVTARVGETGKRTMFHGWVVAASSRAGGRMEDLEYTAYGLDWGLRVEKVFGSWCVNLDDEAVWLRGVQAVFNKDGRFNRHASDAQDPDENQRVVFDLDDDRGNPANTRWSAADMVRYLVSCERKGDLSSSEPRIFETTYRPGGELAEFEPFDVNVEGLDIWSGIVRVASLCSHSVRIRYSDDRSKTELVFFTKKIDEANVVKQFELPEASLENIEIQDRTRLAGSIDVQHDLSGIVRRMDVVAPPKLYEDTWTLLEGWKLEDEEAAFGSGDVGAQVSNFLRETDPETSSDWDRFKYVGRRWILNETGRDDTTTPDVGPFDFAPAFGQDEWAVRLRPFLRTRVSRDESSRTPKPVQIHVTFPGGPPDDIKLGTNVELLPDRAGIYFSGRPLIMPALAFETGDATTILPSSVTIDAVVEGDQDSPHDVYGLASGEDMPVPTFGLVRLDDGYRADTEDDHDDVEDRARKIADEAIAELFGERLVGTVTCPYITFAFDVGDAIDKIKGRNLKVKALVHKVCWDFIQQCTEFALQYPTIDTQGHSRTLEQAPQDLGAHGDDDAQDLSQLLAENAIAGSPLPSAVLAKAAGMSGTDRKRFLENYGRHQAAMDRIASDAMRFTGDPTGRIE